MADINVIAKQFTEYYYNSFDTNRSGLAPLYRPQSMLTFEGVPIQGTESILGKLSTLPFEKVKHVVSTLDAQPSLVVEKAILVMVTGQLVVDDAPNPLHFSQMFHLMPEDTGYFVINDIFRLNYG